MEEFLSNIDSSESSGNSNEAPKEVSEKFKEYIRKSSAGTKRIQKDEKKAQKYDFLLARFLVKIIVDEKYSSILEELFKTLDYGYKSNFILGIISIINIEISKEIRLLSKKEEISFSYKSAEEIEFDDNKLPKEVKNRINYWLEDIIDILIIEYSSIQLEKTIELLKKDDEIISNFTANLFSLFLKKANIKITKNKALNISYFIISEIKKALKNLKIEEI